MRVAGMRRAVAWRGRYDDNACCGNVCAPGRSLAVSWEDVIVAICLQHIPLKLLYVLSVSTYTLHSKDLNSHNLGILRSKYLTFYVP